MAEKPGYHLKQIRRGTVGEFSKIREELEEAQDALDQGAKVMMLVELSDMYGAMELYLQKHFPGITMEDLRKMSAVTRRAFENGRRTSNDAEPQPDFDRRSSEEE